MVITFDNPTAVEFISEIAAEPDCAISATFPRVTLAVMVDGYSGTPSEKLIRPMQFGPWITMFPVPASARNSLSSVAENPLEKTTAECTPARSNAASVPATLGAGIATTARSVSRGSCSIPPAVFSPSISVAVLCTGIIRPSKPACCRFWITPLPCVRRRAEAPTIATVRGRISRDTSRSIGLTAHPPATTRRPSSGAR
jgi:hypothetical protein